MLATKNESPTCNGGTALEPVRPQVRHRIYFAALSIAVLAFSAFALKTLPLPFVWMGLSWAGAFFAAILGLKAPWSRAVVFNCGFLCAGLAAVEAYVALHPRPAPMYSGGSYKVWDDVLGYAPRKGTLTHASRTDGKGLLYDVTYTIDSNGLRVSPPWQKDHVAGTVLFFGCSFTYGEGLRDQETLAYQVGTQSGGRYRTFNFGFHGYGPHQMLAELEHGMVRRIVDTTPRHAIYTAIPNHVVRTAGRVKYGKHAPRYRLDAQGNAYQAGHFDDDPAPTSVLSPEVRWQLSKSAVYTTIAGLDNQQPTDDDIRLLLGVVRKSQELLTTEYPGLQFHVVLWPGVVPSEEPTYEKLRASFRQMGVSLHLVEDILPHFEANGAKYLLGGDDRHPNALANRMLAEYLLTNVLK